MRTSGQRAEPPRPPAFSERDKQRESERKEELSARILREQRSMLRGLILLGVVIVIASLMRAGFGRLFVPGWWNQW